MVQIKCLSNGLYSLKNYHIPFGMGFQPPSPPSGRIPFEQHFSYAVTSLTPLWNIRGILFSLTESKQWTLYCSDVSVAVDIEQTEGNDPPFGC